MRLKASAVLLMVLPLLPETAAAISPPLPQRDEIRVSLLENVNNSDPQVAVFPDGGFVVVWTVGPPDGVGRSVIHARFFAKDGTPASGQFRLVDRAGDSQFVNQVAADRDGTFLVVWTERSSEKSNVIVRRFSRSGKPRGNRIQANVPHRSSRSDGVLAVGADGRFAVAWRANIDLEPEDRSYVNSVARIFDAQGAPLTREFTVGLGYPGIGDDNTYSRPVALALGPDGTLTVQLQDLTTPGISRNYLKRFDAKGKPKKSYALSDPVSCCVNSSGASFGMGPDGSVVATWSQWQLIARRFAPDGAPRGKRFLVGKDLDDDPKQEGPAVAVVAGGISVIVWEEAEDRDGDGRGIFGRVFSAAGMPLSDDLQINTTSAGSQYQPAIASARQGSVVVVWTTYSGGVFARLLTPEP
jgi:hypothetical protein